PLVVTARPLEEAQKVAVAGDLAAALHLLFLKTIEELRDQLQYDPAPCLTAREILANAPLPLRAHSTLSELNHQVEIHYFGRTPCGPADFAIAEERFEAFRAALHAPVVAGVPEETS
ncbi:MAG: hypothetical protein KDC38_19865, partial [Planctomycetes bacterium]|nr:hypothetical protein [Planctomycetota bacterium]